MSFFGKIGEGVGNATLKVKLGIATVAAILGYQGALGQTLTVQDPTSQEVNNAPTQRNTVPSNLGVARVEFCDVPNAVGVIGISADSIDVLSHGPIENLGNGKFGVVISRDKDKVANQYASIEVNIAGSGSVHLTLQFSPDGTQLTSMYRSSLDGNGAPGRLINNLAKPEAIKTDTMPCSQTANGFGWTIPISNRSGTGTGTDIILTPGLSGVTDNGDSLFVPFSGNQTFSGTDVEISIVNINGSVVAYDSVHTTTLPIPTQQSDILGINTNTVTKLNSSPSDVTTCRLTNSSHGTPNATDAVYTFTPTAGGDSLTYIVSANSAYIDVELTNSSAPKVYDITVVMDDCNANLGQMTTNTTIPTSSPDSVEEGHDGLSIYPNPNNTGTLHIQRLDPKNGPYTYKIYNMDGQTVGVGELHPGKTVVDLNGNPVDESSINTDGLEAGMYMTTLTGKNGGNVTIRFVRQ